MPSFQNNLNPLRQLQFGVIPRGAFVQNKG